MITSKFKSHGLFVLCLWVASAFPITSWATLLKIECGTSVNEDSLKVTGSQVIFMSDDLNDIGIENSSLKLAGRNVVISRLEKKATEESTMVSVTHKWGSTGGRTVGTNFMFNLNKCSDENLASLKIRTLGGVAGGRVRELACVCSMD